MKSWLKLLIFALLSLALVSCSGVKKVTISVPADVKERIESSIPQKQFAFYALQEGAPTQLSDLNTRILLACGTMDQQALGRLMASTLPNTNLPLFSVQKSYYADPDMACDVDTVCANTANVQSFTLSGTTVNMPQEIGVFGSHVTNEKLSAACADFLAQNPSTLLLVQRDYVKPPEKVVEIIFK